MRLECIEDIINGMQVFMPSGICAYLSVDNDGNVIAEYKDEMDSYSNTYNQDEFGNIIADGIEIFNEPSQIVMEDYDDVDMDNLHKKFDIKPTIAYELIYDGEPAGYPVHKSEDEIDSYVNELNSKGDIKVTYRKWQQLKEELIGNYVLVKAKDIGNGIEILDVEKGYNSFEDVQMAINDLESEEEFQADPTLMLFVGYEKDGIFYNAVTDEEMGEMEDFEPIAYEDGSKPYSDSKWDRLSDLFQENKIEDMNKLDKIAKVGKDVKDRQKATSLLDATGLGADVKDEVKKFLKKDNEIRKDESLNEDQYEGPDEEEFYTVTFADGTTDNGFSYADGELFYNNELIADIIEVDFNMEVAQKIADYCELELGKQVEDIEDGIGQSLLESMNEISDELANRFLNKRVKNAVDNNYDEESTEKENRALTALIKRKARQGKKLDNNEKQFLAANEAFKKLTKAEQEIEKLLNKNGYKVSQVNKDPGKTIELWYCNKDEKLDGLQYEFGTKVTGDNFKSILKKLEDKFGDNMKESLQRIKVDAIKNDNGTEYYIASYHNGNVGVASRGKTAEEAISNLKQNLSKNYGINEDFNPLTASDEFRYMLLDRMRTDCEYYLKNRHSKHLWAGNVEDQIQTMKDLYNSFKEKPEWITMEDIENYEKQMLQVDESLDGDIVTVINIPFVTEKLYNKLVNALYGNNRGRNRDYEQQQNALNFLQEIEDSIPLQWSFSADLADYGFTVDEINAIKKAVREERVDESLNEALDWDVIFDKHHKAMAMSINNIEDVITSLDLDFGTIDNKLDFLEKKNIRAKRNDNSSIIVYIDDNAYKINFYIDSILGTASVKDYEKLDVNESLNEVKQITKDEWNKLPKDYKMIKNGKKYMMYLDNESHATVLGPVEIVDEKHESLNEEYEDEDILEYIRDFLLENNINLIDLYEDVPDIFEFVSNPPEIFERMSDYVSEKMGYIVGPGKLYELIEEEYEDIIDELDESLNEISQQLKNTVAAKRQINAEKANDAENNILSKYGRGSKAKAAHNKTINAIKKLNKFNRRSSDIIGTDEYQKLGGKFIRPGVPRQVEENNMNNIRKLRIQLESLVNELTSKNEAMSIKDAKALYKKQGFLDTKDDKDAIEALKRGNYTIKTNSRGTATVVELEKLAKNETYNKFIVNMMIDGNKENGSDENIYQEEFDSMKDAIAEVIRLTKTQPQAYIELVNLHTDEILFDSEEVREQDIDYVDAGIETEEDLMEALEDEMLTDINDLDFPDALADTVETTEDGEVLTLEKAVAEIKDEIEDLKDDIKDEIEDLKDGKDIKDDSEIDSKNDDNDNDDDNEDDGILDDTEMEESSKKYLRKGQYEDLNKTKQEIDKLNREGKSADKIKDTITLMSGDEKEEKQATDYAVSKLKESLLNTKYSSKLSNL